MRVAVYGKGGIGKSTVSSNLSYSLAEEGYKVLQIGCDPKADSTRSLLKGKVQVTVTEYMRDTLPSKRKLNDLVNVGSNGVLCIEAGGPKPGVGCAGKGIVGMFQTLEKLNYADLDADITLYDVLGDVVCGGFAVPMRTEHSDSILIVTSGEYMSMFAANNIMKGSLSFEDGKGRIAGLILNRRGLDNEDSLVEEFSRATGVPIVCRISRSEAFRIAESKGMTVSEAFPDSDESKAFSDLAKRIQDITSKLVSPKPLTDFQMDTLYSTGVCEGEGAFSLTDGEKRKESKEKPIVTFAPPRRIGKGPVSALLEGGKVSDIPVVVHGTTSCGYTMLCEVSNERVAHILHDPDAFVSSGDNICCTGMTPDGAVFGGLESLRSTLTDLVKNNDIILVVATCLPGMIGDDCEKVIAEVLKQNPGKKIFYVDANRVDSGFDAHIEIIRELSKLIDTTIEPMDRYINVVDDTFILFNKGDNRKNLDSLLSSIDLMSGPGFLNDCSVKEIIDTRRYGVAVLGDLRRDNLIVKGILESKGIQFMNLPLPRGYRETIRWLSELTDFVDLDDRLIDTVSSVNKEYYAAVSRFKGDLEEMSVVIATWSPKEDVWMAETLSDCGCKVTIHSFNKDDIDSNDNIIIHDNPESLMESVNRSEPDVIIDCIGCFNGKNKISNPETILTHRASIDLMKQVWGCIVSEHNEKWTTWGE